MAATSSVASSVAGTRHACQESPQATIDIDICTPGFVLT